MKQRRSTIRLAAILMSVALLGGACSDDSGSNASGSVALLTFENALLPEAIKPFTDANPDLDLQATTFSSQDEAIAQLESGSEADVVYACLTDTERLVTPGLVQPIDTGRLDAWDSLFPYFKDSSQIRVADTVYMVPAFGGTTGLIFEPRRGPRGRQPRSNSCSRTPSWRGRSRSRTTPSTASRWPRSRSGSPTPTT